MNDGGIDPPSPRWLCRCDPRPPSRRKTSSTQGPFGMRRAMRFAMAECALSAVFTGTSSGRENPLHPSARVASRRQDRRVRVESFPRALRVAA
jgi:hypothetical protein